MNPQPKPVRSPKEPKPIKRKAQLRAKRWGVSRGPSKLQRKQTEADSRYLMAVRALPCAVQEEVRRDSGALIPDMCSLPSHAHHAGRRPGVGLKAADDTAIPLCAYHQQWHDANGVFAGWTKQQRRRWADAAIRDTRRLVGDAQLAGTQVTGGER